MGNMFGLTSDEKKSNDEATAPNVSPVVPVSQIGGYRSRKNKTRTRRSRKNKTRTRRKY
jgi:hypothetical protein